MNRIDLLTAKLLSEPDHGAELLDAALKNSDMDCNLIADLAEVVALFYRDRYIIDALRQSIRRDIAAELARRDPKRWPA